MVYQTEFIIQFDGSDVVDAFIAFMESKGIEADVPFMGHLSWAHYDTDVIEFMQQHLDLTRVTVFGIEPNAVQLQGNDIRLSGIWKTVFTRQSGHRITIDRYSIPAFEWVLGTADTATDGVLDVVPV